jgi:hypothetical protein
MAAADLQCATYIVHRKVETLTRTKRILEESGIKLIPRFHVAPRSLRVEGRSNRAMAIGGGSVRLCDNTRSFFCASFAIGNLGEYLDVHALYQGDWTGKHEAKDGDV